MKTTVRPFSAIGDLYAENVSTSDNSLSLSLSVLTTIFHVNLG